MSSFIFLQYTRRCLRRFFPGYALVFAGLCLFAAQPALCQNLVSTSETGDALSAAQASSSSTIDPLAQPPALTASLAPSVTEALPSGGDKRSEAKSPTQPIEKDMVFEGLASYGHYILFASGSGCKLYTAGVEYDRHSWGRFIGARLDYVAEFLPVVLLDAPLTQDIYGTPTSPNRHVVPGIGFSPIGFRLLWRDKKTIKPYLTAKGGVLVFSQKVLSQQATYENFSLQTATGVNVRMNERWDLRLGLFSDFHFSNAFIVPINPGLDVMNANLGLSYHF